ncbi:MAG: hypothetical protein E7495_07960 [Ruminococcus flavefaciens]|jgi:hypothetical protein|nr:hypothetical protein [Ruminococcus flavefaciens]
MNEMTLAEWLDKWYNLYAKPFLKASTLVSYNGYIKNHNKDTGIHRKAAENHSGTDRRSPERYRGDAGSGRS